MKSPFLLLPVLILIGCTPAKEDMIFHYSVLKALDNGVLEGNMTVGELKKHGDFGLGTFNRMNGEMVVLDHIVYRVSPDGKVEQPDDVTLIPYTVVTFFNQDDTLEMNGVLDYPALKAFADRRLPSKNLFYAFRISGVFQHIRVGGADLQEKPYDKSLVQMLGNRPQYTGRDIKGTLVGFWCPAYIGDINSAGFHLHFISDDRTIGGHLMEFSAESLEIAYDVKPVYKIYLPDTDIFKKARFRNEPVNY